MSFVIPLIFNAIELCVLTINGKLWTRAKEICRALEYGKATEVADIVKHLCSKENYTQKYQLSSVHAINWPKYSQKYNYYISEEGMCELLVGSKQPG